MKISVILAHPGKTSFNQDFCLPAMPGTQKKAES